MNQVRPKRPRLRLDPEMYEHLRLKCYVATAGDANPAARGQTLRSTTKNFVAILVMILSRT